MSERSSVPVSRSSPAKLTANSAVRPRRMGHRPGAERRKTQLRRLQRCKAAHGRRSGCPVRGSDGEQAAEAQCKVDEMRDGKAEKVGCEAEPRQECLPSRRTSIAIVIVL